MTIYYAYGLHSKPRLISFIIGLTQTHFYISVMNTAAAKYVGANMFEMSHFAWERHAERHLKRHPKYIPTCRYVYIYIYTSMYSCFYILCLFRANPLSNVGSGIESEINKPLSDKFERIACFSLCGYFELYKKDLLGTRLVGKSGVL